MDGVINKCNRLHPPYYWLTEFLFTSDVHIDLNETTFFINHRCLTFKGIYMYIRMDAMLYTKESASSPCYIFKFNFKFLRICQIF